MKTKLSLLKNESGSVLILAIMILALLTIIGLTASRNSHVEVMIANNAMYHQRTFYAAESGLVHTIGLLEKPFAEANALRALAGATLDWDFALDGTYRGPALDPLEDGTPGYDPDNNGQRDGSIWIDRATLDASGYTTSLWNNRDAGNNYINDTDAVIWLQSDAADAMGARSSVRILLQGNTRDEVVFGYRAQAGAGAGKNYNASDSSSIGQFDKQYRTE